MAGHRVVEVAFGLLRDVIPLVVAADARLARPGSKELKGTSWGTARQAYALARSEFLNVFFVHRIRALCEDYARHACGCSGMGGRAGSACI